MAKSGKIKILYTIPNFNTAGSGKVVYDLVKHIDQSIFEPHICCEHKRGDFFSKVQALGVSIHTYKVTSTYRPFLTLPFRIIKVYKFFKTHKFNIIHSWHWSSDFTEPLAAKMAGIPFVYTKKAMGWGNKSWQWRSQLSKAIVTLNNDMETQFFSKMKEKVHPIPIGLNIKDFGVLEKVYNTNDGFEVNSKDFVIVSIANLVPVKGIEFLLEAVKQINNSKIKVVIVGDDSSDYAKKLKQVYVKSNIVFTGKKQNIKEYLALADVFVIPTKQKGEGQPIAPIEAMLSGRVVLGSNVSGINDLLSVFKDCLFKPESIKDIEQKIKWIMQKPEEERMLMANKMYNYAAKAFNIQKSITQHKKLYLDLVN